MGPCGNSQLFPKNMNAFTYTPTEEVAAGFTYANAKAKAAHDAAQASHPEVERADYAVTDENYAKAALDRVGERYVAQELQERAAEPDNQALLLATLANSDDPGVANAIAELQKAVAAATA